MPAARWISPLALLALWQPASATGVLDPETLESPAATLSTAWDIEEFVLSGYPHLEEAYRFGEGVAPVLRRRGLFGERALAGAGAAA